MSFMSWLPGAFKEMLGHVPTILFDVVSWGALTKDATLLSKRLLTKEGESTARGHLDTILPAGMVFTQQATTLPTSESARTMLGEKILALYFRQIQRPGPMFLDLRLAGFGVAENQIVWNPTSLWGEFSLGFVDGLKDLYDGFYQNDENLFRAGLTKTGLIQADWSEADKTRMSELFRANFGSAVDNSMEFKLDRFQNSFQKVFAFLLEKKVKLTTDFLLLGVMLVTLYLSLEQLGGEYPVAKIYREARL